MQEMSFTILHININEQPMFSCSTNSTLSSVDTESEGLVVMAAPICPKENLNFELILAVCVSTLQKLFAAIFTNRTNPRVQTASITSSPSSHAHLKRWGAQGAQAALPPKKVQITTLPLQTVVMMMMRVGYRNGLHSIHQRVHFSIIQNGCQTTKKKLDFPDFEFLKISCSAVRAVSAFVHSAPPGCTRQCCLVA
jgi:hypothetical protein